MPIKFHSPILSCFRTLQLIHSFILHEQWKSSAPLYLHGNHEKAIMELLDCRHTLHFIVSIIFFIIIIVFLVKWLRNHTTCDVLVRSPETSWAGEWHLIHVGAFQFNSALPHLNYILCSFQLLHNLCLCVGPQIASQDPRPSRGPR